MSAHPVHLSRLLEQPSIGAHLSPAQWESAIHRLRNERLLGTLFHRACSEEALENYPAYAQRHLTSTSALAARQAQQVRYECDLLTKALHAVDVTPVFLKGAAYTLRETTNGLGRLYSDIDVLVTREAIDTAEQTLQTQGFERSPRSDYDDFYYREWAHEVPPLINRKRGTVIDLHHNLVPPISGRAPSAATLLAQRQTLPNGFTTLTPEAMTLHSMVHLLMNDDIRRAYRDLVDLWLLMHEHDGDDYWEALLGLATETRYEAELWYTLCLIKHQFKSFEAPTRLLDKLNARFQRTGKQTTLNAILKPAIQPSPQDLPATARLARFLAYARGHWLKMPFAILARHTVTKSWFALRDKVFGRYQFEESA